MTRQTISSPAAAIRRTLLVGLSISAAMVASATVLAYGVDLSGAVVANGAFVVDSHVKPIKPQAAGVVAQLAVGEGARVKAGDLLARLDDVQARANLAIVSTRLDELLARRARLSAERDGKEAVSLPQALADRAESVGLGEIMNGERRLFETRSNARAGQKAQLNERIAQLHQEAEGLVIQKSADDAEIVILERELESVRFLWERKLTVLQRLTSLERDGARLQGRRGRTIASLAENSAKIAENKLKLIQVDQDAMSEIAKELRDVDVQIAETQEKKIAAENDLRHLDIRSPQDGVVHELSVHAKGAVIGAGEQIMQIVPVSDTLKVEARVAPQEIDQVHPNQTVVLRVTGLNQRITPELNGVVERVAPDLSQDQKTKMPFYTVRLSVSAAEFARLESVKFVPGMPVEAFIRTSSRSMMSYLVKPLTDQIGRAFREQ